MNGEQIINRNRSCNVMRSRLYVCPICGNVIHCTGETVVSCCGITLPPLDAEEPDAEHTPVICDVEDAHFLTISHPMTKTHYISFMAFASSDRFELVKLYPEGNAEARMLLHGHGIFLDLPAVVPGAVVAQGEKQIAHSVRPPFPENPHIQTGSSRFPATTAVITRATTAQAQRSTRPTWSWRIFVTRGLMP